MSDKLKTLEDFYTDFGMDKDGEYISKEELKQEAIKWVKYFSKIGNLKITKLPEVKFLDKNFVVENGEFESIDREEKVDVAIIYFIGLIAYMNNITEEDLK